MVPTLVCAQEGVGLRTPNVRFGSKGQRDVRFAPNSGHSRFYAATRSISVGSSAIASELFTRRDTGHNCKERY